jgi:type VI secretion system protein VasG
MKVELKVLIEKLNPLARAALESAAELCVRQTNYNVELEHYLRTMLDRSDSDLHVILRQYDVDEARLLDELTRAIESFARGNTRTPALSPNIPRLLEQAWSIASLQIGAQQIRSGALLAAALTDPALRGVLEESAPVLLQIPRETLQADLGELLRHSAEGPTPTVSGGSAAASSRGGGGSGEGRSASRRSSSGSAAAPSGSTVAGGPASSSGAERALDRFTVDLTAMARAGGIDPIRGRDGEIRQIIDILMRRRQNNPILTGEPGVGKTAVVEGFALRVAAGTVPESLREATVRTLDLGLLQAGAGVKGEFEHRLKTVIDEVHSSPSPIILFIDEAHTIIGAGGAEGQGDAANLLKPALARGELRTIAATTWSEYKKYVEKDPALARRFQVIKVEEPDEETATEMLRGMVSHLERHHGVRITDAAVRSAVELSHRHISGRQLPDKAISVIDTACARVAIGQSSAPRQVEDAAREVQRLEIELGILERELTSGADHADRIEQLRPRLARARLTHLKLEERWHVEADIVRSLNRVQTQLRGEAFEPDPELETDADASADPADPAALQAKRDDLTAELEAVRAGEVLVPVCVDDDIVASVISDWTGIPVGNMVKNEIRAVISLRARMQDRIIGQDHALEAIARRIGTSSAHLEDPQKPSGVFLLVGPSGVGKTETAVTLADFLYGGERNMITVNMSEYQEAHTVSSLKGAPPGYVGYGSGGVLTEAVRRRPYSVVLLDEVEKAHPDVLELFYQVFDKGFMEDGEGQHIDFRHTIILLTSNVGSDTIIRACRSGEAGPQPDQLVELIRPELRQHFPAAFLGRLVVVPYLPLQDVEIGEIVRLKMARVQKRFWERHGAELTFDAEVAETIAQRCTEVDSGARNIDHILSDGILPELSIHVLEEMAEGRRLSGVHIGIEGPGGFSYDLTTREAGT